MTRQGAFLVILFPSPPPGHLRPSFRILAFAESLVGTRKPTVKPKLSRFLYSSCC